ncbi:DUF1328 domain-containing protein [Micavibrio aeruginosavorus]|uniref:Uncharacterized protein n=1 Tax=Micavibrio aeruginosavorus (strain ARL-13) TaxID=856793 RepID=G2KRE5_MICAA|nr:DUF1328 domain-containing protein [Micavibrio aeruginosavorus]AEP09192.1 conserved hypothetical protein [Micavibrio aeruginosavorus ARL-13]
MLQYAVLFLILALIAGFFGFSGVATVSVGFAKILFLLFVVLFIASAVFGFIRRPHA